MKGANFLNNLNLNRTCVISMEFLPLSRRRSSVRNVPSGEERGEKDVFAGYFSRFYPRVDKKPTISLQNYSILCTSPMKSLWGEEFLNCLLICSHLDNSCRVQCPF